MSWIERLIYKRVGRNALMSWIAIFTVVGGFVVSSILLLATLEKTWT